MGLYLVKRILQAVFVLLAASTVTFFILRLAGDPVSLILPPEATQVERDQLTEQLNLDKPVILQYALYLKNITKGDFGESYWQKRPALDIVLERYPATLQLATAAIIVAILIAVPIGVLSAVKKGSWVDYFAMMFALFGHAMPTFWLGILAISIFAVHFNILPAFGRGTIAHMIMPTITLALYSTARLSRLTRSSMLEVLNSDYIRTAYAKGLRSNKVIFKHALKNALLPIFTLAALEYGILLGGAVLTETIFAWPGLGWLAIEAISRRDFPLVQAVVLSVAWIFVLINLVTDLLYSVIDPRVRLD